jgi:phospholipase/lecithinase/hemolysin
VIKQLIGNFLKFIANDIEVPPVYYDGRYTNGLLWHEYLLEETTLARQSENYAHAWATASDVCTRKSEERPAVPDLLSQLAVWEEKNPAISCRRNLYSIWIGGNDYVKKDLPFMSADKLEGMIQQAVQPIVQTMIRILAKDPCATFLLPTILPGEVLPVCPPIRRLKDKIGSIVDKHDWILDESLRSLAMVYNLPAERFIRVDVKSFMRQLVADPESFGFGSDLEPCIRTIETKNHQPTANSCADPERRIFIDEIHISTRVHRIIASMISQAVLNCCLDCDEC